eukprot:11856520-Karenia_brevis.AAC.1
MALASSSLCSLKRALLLLATAGIQFIPPCPQANNQVISTTPLKVSTLAYKFSFIRSHESFAGTRGRLFIDLVQAPVLVGGGVPGEGPWNGPVLPGGGVGGPGGSA